MKRSNLANPPPTVISLLARAPELGTVKSRLARHIGQAQALRTHIELLQHNLTVAIGTGLPVELVVAGNPQHPWLQRAVAQLELPVLVQSEGDIGERMFATARRVTERDQSSLIIGSDCGVMSVAYLQAAADTLAAGAPIVFGPAEDGGYVLVGQRRALPAAFAGVSWGSEQVMQQTRAALLGAGIEWKELATLWDVDTVADLRRLRQSTPRSISA